MWAHVERKACCVRHPSRDELMSTVNKVWAEMSEAEVVKICSVFRKRMKKCVEMGGNSF